MSQIATLVLRHLGAYTTLIRADVGDALASWQRQVISALALALLGYSALLVASVCAILLTWGSSYWTITVIAVGAVHACGMVFAYWSYAHARTSRRPVLENAEAEWARDRLLFEDALRRLTEEPTHG